MTNLFDCILDKALSVFTMFKEPFIIQPLNGLTQLPTMPIEYTITSPLGVPYLRVGVTDLSCMDRRLQFITRQGYQVLLDVACLDQLIGVLIKVNSRLKFEDQPMRYKPSALQEKVKQPKEIAYAIGILQEGSEESIGMVFGPVPNEHLTLEEIGEENHVIIRFNPDGSHEIIWVWDTKTDEWVSK